MPTASSHAAYAAAVCDGWRPVGMTAVVRSRAEDTMQGLRLALMLRMMRALCLSRARALSLSFSLARARARSLSPLSLGLCWHVAGSSLKHEFHALMSRCWRRSLCLRPRQTDGQTDRRQTESEREGEVRERERERERGALPDRERERERESSLETPCPSYRKA